MTKATALLKMGMTPRRVEHTLKHDESLEDYRHAIPTWRTLYDIAADLGQSAGSNTGAWSLLDADPEDARLVLPVMREMNRTGHGFLGWNLPKDVARWITVVRTADPDIPLLDSFYQALRYVQAEASIGDPAEADRWMVLELWKENPAAQTRAKFQAARTQRRAEKRRQLATEGNDE